jgi:hypothetical protein
LYGVLLPTQYGRLSTTQDGERVTVAAVAGHTYRVTGTASAPSKGNHLRDPKSNRCADLAGSGSADGTELRLADCATTSSSQGWTYTGRQLVGEDGKCLDANGNGSQEGRTTARAELRTDGRQYIRSIWRFPLRTTERRYTFRA